MSGYEWRSYIPSSRPPPIIINREPDVRPLSFELEIPNQTPQSLTFGEKIYNLFHPKSKRIVVSETRYRKRRTHPEELHHSSSPHSSSAPPLGRRHSLSGSMSPPYVPLPPPIVLPTRPQSHRRHDLRPEVEERAPERTGAKVYPHPLEPRERVLDSSQSPPRQTVTIEVNEPVRSRHADDAETRKLRQRIKNLSQDLELSKKHEADLKHELAQREKQLAQQEKQSRKARERIESLERKAKSCKQNNDLREAERRVAEEEKRVVIAEAQLDRMRLAEAKAALEQERQRSREREREMAARPRRPTTVVQPGPPAPRPNNDPSMDAIRRAQEEARRGGRR